MYAERPSPLPGVAAWRRADDRPARVLPDGCIDIIWTGERLVVAGPDTTAHVSHLPAGGGLTGLRFAPGTGPHVLGLPAGPLSDLRVGLDDVWPAATTRRLAERLAAAADPAPVLEAAVAGRLPEAPTTMIAVATLLGAGRAVGDVAADVGLSPRQLQRRSIDAFGYGPKLLARILRFGHALGLVRAGVPPVDAAVRCGYADQAHLARDVRQLAGVTLGALVAP